MSTTIAPSSRFRPRPDVLSRELDGDAVLLDLATGRYFSLNPTGRRIFELLNGERTTAEVLERLAAEFEAPAAELQVDLATLLSELESQRLIEPSE